ncbi:AAA family ATPase [Cerasicoccus arenae]|uniref:ATPase AAA n=1 Tax=Cerasicoccus arenae TaxID=424488 RepID=A0A8J3GFA2_9BACT|nr:MoxR family ATPase [Cerasicoccus arenae]GHC09830.1 ATPase AAA [Cerasicoccus arenae]
MTETEDYITQITEEVQSANQWLPALYEQLAKRIVGQHYLIDRLLVGLLANGHVLLEGLPGLAKTSTINALALAVNSDFSRIQFTPDLLPADLIGTLIYNAKDNVYTTHKGPLFGNLILADEINRAPAKVQSALLEAMQEHQVTIGDTIYPLPEPFLVLATQNPVDQEGTYPLPEAQMDRFMLKVVVEYPEEHEELQILDIMAQTRPKIPIEPVLSPEHILAMQDIVDKIYVDTSVRQYIVSLVMATREPARVDEELVPYIKYGASPRATINLTLAARAKAFLSGRGYVTPDDVKDMALDVMRHRINTTYEAAADEVTREDILTRVLELVPVP